MWRVKRRVGETFLRLFLFILFFLASLEKGSAFRHKLLVVLEASHLTLTFLGFRQCSSPTRGTNARAEVQGQTRVCVGGYLNSRFVCFPFLASRSRQKEERPWSNITGSFSKFVVGENTDKVRVASENFQHDSAEQNRQKTHVPKMGYGSWLSFRLLFIHHTKIGSSMLDSSLGIILVG